MNLDVFTETLLSGKKIKHLVCTFKRVLSVTDRAIVCYDTPTSSRLYFDPSVTSFYCWQSCSTVCCNICQANRSWRETLKFAPSHLVCWKITYPPDTIVKTVSSEKRLSWLSFSFDLLETLKTHWKKSHLQSWWLLGETCWSMSPLLKFVFGVKDFE